MFDSEGDEDISNALSVFSVRDELLEFVAELNEQHDGEVLLVALMLSLANIVVSNYKEEEIDTVLAQFQKAVDWSREAARDMGLTVPIPDNPGSGKDWN